MRHDRETARFGGAQRESSLTSTTRELTPLLARLYTFTVQAANVVDCFLPDADTLGLEYGMRVVVANRGIGGTGNLRLWVHDADLGDVVRNFYLSTWDASGTGLSYEISGGYLAIARIAVGPTGQREWLVNRKAALGRTIL